MAPLSGPAPELRAGPLVFVDDLEAPQIHDDDLRHLRRSLRLGDGDGLCVADGAGAWRTANLAGSRLVDLGVVHDAEVASPEIVVGLAIPKGSRLDVAVAKLTELGVDHIQLLATERSVVRWSDSEVPRRLERLRRVAREAAMQSRRPRLPGIAGVLAISEVVARWPGGVALAEPGGPPPDPARPVILIGPEGGWTPAELGVCADRVGLGPTVLRIETAAIAAGVVLAGQRAGWLR